jgi:hypothetical protein
MRELSFQLHEAVDRLREQVGEFATAVRTLAEMQLLAPSLCHGWSVLDLVVHVRMGLPELAIGTTRRTHEAADHDAASYWGTHPDSRDDDPVPHILWLRRVASAYLRPVAAVAHLSDTATDAVTAVSSMPAGVVDFQGKRMRSGDFAATWVVELAVHQLDLGMDGAAPSGLAWTRMTLEALADADLPAGPDDRSAVLIALGRVPSPDSVHLAPSFPVSL